MTVQALYHLAWDPLAWPLPYCWALQSLLNTLNLEPDICLSFSWRALWPQFPPDMASLCLCVLI